MEMLLKDSIYILRNVEYDWNLQYIQKREQNITKEKCLEQVSYYRHWDCKTSYLTQVDIST